MASVRSTSTSTHGRFHKRGQTSPYVPTANTQPLPPSRGHSSFEQRRLDPLRSVPDEEAWEGSPQPGAAPGASLKIKPYLRKLSTKESGSNIGIDLSRPAAENEKIAGLGIYDTTSGARSASDVTFARTKHNRSTSNTSQFSTASSMQRMPYAHPMRQTPRPYTPPMPKSYTTSVIGRESEDVDNIMSDDEFRLRQQLFDASRRSDSISSMPAAPPPLHLNTANSYTRLAPTASQTSLHSSSRPRGDTLRSIETLSPSSRTSMDKAFNFVRSRDEPPVDPADRAASIRAARQAYREREEAKDRKAEKELMKQQEKDHAKKSREEERQRRKSSVDENRRQRSRTISNEKVQGVGGREYAHHTNTHTRALPIHRPTLSPSRRAALYNDTDSNHQGLKKRWLAFVAWFKTRVIRISRKMNLAS
ncbi:hypothetical protein K402DRAFT_25824 [Aulographum hederae CBS 113979]|uniref:Uncharacterized protein n=1 Tax=Aulographum hederae CBS 113979 TaxID=1176131 RepID=A0A6G1H5P3_9PEZI|nr:hypothetical protein K402DRAFT_25824 [Aulographum hederae CBS 113979]